MSTAKTGETGLQRQDEATRIVDAVSAGSSVLKEREPITGMQPESGGEWAGEGEQAPVSSYEGDAPQMVYSGKQSRPVERDQAAESTQRSFGDMLDVHGRSVQTRDVRAEAPGASTRETGVVPVVARGGEIPGVSMEQTDEMLKNILPDYLVQRNAAPREASSVARAAGVQQEARSVEAAEVAAPKPSSMEGTVSSLSGEIENMSEKAGDAEERNAADDDQPTFSAVDRFPSRSWDGLSTDVFKSAQKSIRDTEKAALADKGWNGNAFTEKAVASDKVDPLDISVGSIIVREMVREPGNNLIDFVNNELHTSFTLDQLMTPEGFSAFVDAVNSADIYVVATKSPVMKTTDVQRRRLRIHDGRGIKIHRTQTVIYNLDFDGDDVSVSITVDKNIRSAMDMLVDEAGKAMIDVDFFPLEPMDSDREKFNILFKDIFLTEYQGKVDLQALCDDIMDGMFDVTHPDTRLEGDALEKSKNSAWVRVLRAMEKLGTKAAAAIVGGDRAVEISNIIKDIYDNMSLIHKISLKGKASSFSDTPIWAMGNESSPGPIKYVNKIIGNMADGIMPPTFQSFIIGMNNYIGEVEGKNVYFRLGAKYAKTIKMDKSFFKGDSNARELYEKTLEAGMAMFMNGRVDLGQKVSYMRKLVAIEVFNEVGLPASYLSMSKRKDGSKTKEPVQAFLDAFKTSWNRHMACVEAAQVKFSCEMDPLKDPDARSMYISNDATLKDYRAPLLAVYGELTLDNFLVKGFKNLMYVDSLNKEGVDAWYEPGTGQQLLGRYKWMTLREISRSNRVPIPKKGYPVGKDEFKKIGDLPKDSALPYHLFILIADGKTSAASKYNQTFNDAAKDFAKCLVEISRRYDKRYDNQADFAAYVEDVLSALYVAGADMFLHYGMDSPANFMNSKWGALLYDAAKHGSDAVGGVLMSMRCEYRMRRIDAINEQINSIVAENAEDLHDYYSDQAHTVTKIPSMVNALQNRLVSELEALRSSSDLWSVLVSEIMGNNTAYAELKLGKGTCLDNIDAKFFWTIGSRRIINQYSWAGANDYNSLLEVMLDPSIPKEEKCSIAHDVVRHATGYVYSSAYEMTYQLDIDPDPGSTSLTLAAYREQPSVISDMTESHNRVERMMKNDWGKVRDDVSKARSIYGKTNGSLERYLKDLAEDPSFFLEIPNEFVADAIGAEIRPTQKRAEKAKQEIASDGYYNAGMTQIGGVTDALYRCEARALGMIPEHMLSAYDYICALADPEFEIIVFNGDTQWILSRETLCGGNSEEDVWDMLESNPRIAALVRPCTVTFSSSGTRMYTNARMSFSDAMGVMKDRTRVDRAKGRIRSECLDSPLFVALVAQGVPAHNRQPRSIRQDHANMVDAMLMAVAKYGADVVKGKIKPTSSILADKDSFNLSVDTLVAVGMDRKAAQDWIETLTDDVKNPRGFRNLLNKAARIIREEGLTDEDVSALLESYAADRVKYSFDRDSVALAQDVRQTLTGAKTETQTAVEGNMTQENLGFGLFSWTVEDRHEVIDSSMDQAYLDQFKGCMTNAGLFDGTNIRQLEDSLKNSLEPLVVEAPEGWNKKDPTLSDTDHQMSTLGRYLSIKRKRAAEEDNLKSRKSGDDGKDSVTKSHRYDPDAKLNLARIRKAYEDAPEGAKFFAAKTELARILMRSDHDEGYTDMDLADYMDIAQVMLKRVVDESGQESYVLRSIGQLSASVRKNMPESVIESGTPADIAAEAARIADETGLVPFRLEDLRKEKYIDSVRQHALTVGSSICSYPAIGKYRAPIAEDASSADRNYEMLQKLAKGGEVKLPWSGTVVTNNKAVVGTKANIKYWSFTGDEKKGKLSAWRALAVKFDKGDYASKKNPWDVDHFYNVINVSRGNDSITSHTSPGRGSVWVIQSGATQKQIREAVNACYSYGMTLAFIDVSLLGKYGDKYDEIFAKDITPAPFGSKYFMIDFFDMRINGGYASAPMAPETYDEDPTCRSLIVEDPDNFYSLADAEVLVDSRTISDTHCGATGHEQIKVNDLFYNIMNSDAEDPYSGYTVKDVVHDIQMCDVEEIFHYLVKPYIMNGEINAPIDLGIFANNPHEKDIVSKFYNVQMMEYVDDFKNADQHGILDTGRPDRIIGWVKAYVGSDPVPVFAPIIPFPTGTSLSAPMEFGFDIVNLTDGSMVDGGTVDFDWHESGSLENQVAKFHDGSNPAGKGIVFFSRDVHLGNLKNGRRVDHIKAAETDASRKIGTEKKLATFETLAIIARDDYGFNFANLSGAFPDGAITIDGELVDVKAKLMSEWISIDEWAKIYREMARNKRRFHADETVDMFVRAIVKKAIDSTTTSPTDLLACRFTAPDGTVFGTHRRVNYSFFFQPAPEFENAMLAFYNKMIPELCPPSIDEYDDGTYHLFKPVSDPTDPFMYGCLQVEVPFPDPMDRNKTFYTWCNAYLPISYYNEEYTGTHKPGLNGASRKAEETNALAISGYWFQGKSAKNYAKAATAPAYRSYDGCSVVLDRAAFLRKGGIWAPTKETSD